jgi:hypothetical protein
MSLELLKKIRDRVSDKTPMGLYASTQIDGITVGLSDFRFDGRRKTELTAYLSLTGTEEAKEKVKKALAEAGIPLSEAVITRNSGESRETWLVKVKLPLEFKNNAVLEKLKKAAEELKGLRTLPPEESLIPKSQFLPAENFKAEHKLLDALIQLAEKEKVKVVVPLGNGISVEINSLYAEKGNLFAGVKKKLARGFFKEEELEITLPSDAFLTRGEFYTAVVPLTGSTFKEAVNTLKEKARARKITPKEKNQDPKF